MIKFIDTETDREVSLIDSAPPEQRDGVVLVERCDNGVQYFVHQRALARCRTSARPRRQVGLRISARDLEKIVGEVRDVMDHRIPRDLVEGMVRDAIAVAGRSFTFRQLTAGAHWRQS